MIRGTTPTIILHTGDSVNLSLVSKAYVTISQIGTQSLDLDIERLTLSQEAHTIAAELTQEETLAFYDGPLSIQARLLLSDGTAIASNIVSTTMQKILKEGVI